MKSCENAKVMRESEGCGPLANVGGAAMTFRQDGWWAVSYQEKGQTKTILFVDGEEENVMAPVKLGLEPLGHGVTTFNDPMLVLAGVARVP
jgi:hypothetical protein